jgi:asparagine synthase (glutamine-hydrolysing)
MCGFFGSFSNSKNSNLLISGQKLDHRGPDDTQNYKDDYLNCSFFRLNILGGNDATQPMLSNNGRWLILFNGEVYNYIELGEELGYSNSKNLSDTKVILEQFSKFGIKALEKFNGMFAIVLYDRTKKKIFLIRDRLGTKPLYYSLKNNILYFASEIKSIPIKKEAEESVVNDYLALGKYPRITTFYKHIYNVDPSHIISFDKNNFKKTKYFFLKKEVDERSKKKIEIEEYYSLLENSIKIRQRSNPNINIHLSGGIDSTALLILTKKLWEKQYKLKTYSFSYKNYKLDEYDYIQNISKKLQVPNKRIIIDPKEIPFLAKNLQFYQDEPFGGLASIAEYKLNIEQKKDNNLVSFEGIGGDELLGGYKSHYLLAIRDLYYSGKSEKLMRQMIYNSKINLKKILSITDKFIKSGFNGNTDLSQIRYIKNLNKYKLSNKNFYDKIKYHDIEFGSLYRSLRFRDRSSSACGRELRFPLLDHKLLILSLALPLHIKFANGLTKSPLRNVIKTYLPKDYYLPKRSVSSPQTYWLKKELKDWTMDNIRSLQSKKIINKNFFKKVNYFFKYEINNSFYIWQLINLNLFYNNLKNINDKK